MLEAPAARVYAKALEVARRNNVMQLREDAARPISRSARARTT
jgi:hypothetical protein